ncbi:MAG: alpha-glucan family phosphorylase [Actinobacteria bacterium]|nr:alpha-glucan family phosphorylase [Actinomycetota bacterium]
MKALRSFAVRASLPDELQPLVTLAMNLRWSWNPQAVDVFRWVDLDKWEEAEHDPVRMLGLVTPERLAELAGDGPFTSFMGSVVEDHERYLTEPRWFQRHHPDAVKTVAYFSPEFGVSEALPVYSGGLGVLAGDHLKAASDLGVPLVGVGLLYREGYFRQQLNADGWQQERYPALDPHGMPLTLLSGVDGSALKIEVDLAGTRCVAQVWQAMVGRVPLLLLDCDVEENDPEERAVSDRLYGGGGGSEHRLRQEIVLGIGGVRALEAAGYSPDVYHSNEGHAGFLTVERMRTLIAAEGLTFDQAIEAVRTSTVFTTHTPVPAGIDVFEGELFERYFATFSKELDVPLAELMALGQTVPSVPGVYNMAISGLRLAGRSNGVSKLHGAVSRSMFADLWPHVPVDHVPITSITNGVHRPTWVGPEISELLDRYLAPGWAEAAEGDWSRIHEAPDSELWRARERARERFVFFVRERLEKQLRARGMSEGDLAWTSDTLDPGILTVGFARRFAMYKRGTLLLSDVERLKGLLHSSDRPVQFVFAGKSHPLDDGGKEMIQILVHFASDPEHRTRFVFLEDYDMEIARMMVQGVDIWLNNPRRPLEASGTSGMKAALNGALNCSVLDGWWDECYDRTNGWAIGTRDVSTDPEYQDKVDASALFDLLERDIAPRFYDRSEGPIPRRWIERVRSSMTGLGPFVGAQRMVRDYTETFYVPAGALGSRMAADGHAPIKALAAWKERIRNAWDQVAVIDVEGDVLAADVGEERSVRATVRIGELDTEDVSVQLAHGRVGANGELLDPEIVPMAATECTNGTCNYNAKFTAASAGLYGFAVRVIPTHPDLVTDMDLGLVAWA